jgi:CRP-like cAMP-binding protein
MSLNPLRPRAVPIGHSKLNGNPRAQTAATEKSKRELLEHIGFLEPYSKTEILDVLVASTDYEKVDAGTILYRQREDTTHLYYIIAGQVKLTRHQANKGGQESVVVEQIAHPGRLLDSYALVYNLPYTATAVAETALLVLRFPTSALERLLYRFPNVRPRIIQQERINRLRTIPLLRGLGLVSLSYLAEDLRIMKVGAGQILYQQHESANLIYLVHQGQVSLLNPRIAEDPLWIGTGGTFGFPWQGGSGGADVRYGHIATVEEEGVLYCLPWTSLKRMAHVYPHLLDPRIQRIPFETLSQVSVFEQYSEPILRKLAGYCSFQHIPQHHMIMQQGDIGDSMWILTAGGKATLSALGRDDRALPRTPVDGIVYFGEVALRVARDVRSTVEAEPGSLWLRLHWRDFRHFLEMEGQELQEKLNIRLPEEENAPKFSGFEHPWLGEGEVMIDLRRRHWIALLPKMLWAALFFFLGAPLAVLSITFLGVNSILAYGVAGVLVTLAVAWGLIDYLNDFLIITNQRVIQQEKMMLTSEYRREALLEQVERIDSDTSFWGNLLGYGSLRIFTAGTTGYFAFDRIPDPASLKNKIGQERDLRRKRYQAESKLAIQTALEQRLGLNMVLPSRVHTSVEGERQSGKARQGWVSRQWQKLMVGSTQTQSNMDKVVWRQHWIYLIQDIATPLIFFLFLLVAMVGTLITYTLGGGDTGFGVGALLTRIAWLDGLFWAVELLLAIPTLISFGFLVYRIADWYNDTYEISGDKITDVEKLPFFLGETRREARLNQIQDVTYEIRTPIEMLFNVGNVTIQTAASEGALTFHKVGAPREVKEEINRRLVEWRRRDEQRQARERLQDLPDWFELYNRLEAGQEPSRNVSDEPRSSTPQT